MLEKTVRKAERAWFLDERRGERSLDPSGIASLGKYRVFSKHLTELIDKIIGLE